LKIALIAVALAACVDPVDAEWQLDHDHVIAARVTPSGLAAGEQATIDALVAHAGAPTSVEVPDSVSAPTAPATMSPALALAGGTWTVTAPNADAIASARPALGLAADAPVPVELLLAFGDRYVKKTVWIGTHADNPALPQISVDGVQPADTIEIPRGRDVPLAADATRVNWLTSVGNLHEDDEPDAYVRADAADAGELAVVVRSEAGGVVWHVWPIAAP
jgi:hypothetical protein